MEQATFIIMRGNYKNKDVITRFKSLMFYWVEKYLFFYVIVVTFLIQELDKCTQLFRTDILLKINEGVYC